MSKYLFSHVVNSNSESEAIESMQNQNINPADMDITELNESKDAAEVDNLLRELSLTNGEEKEEVWTVVGIYADNNQRYAAHFYTKTPEEAQAKAEEKNVIVAGVIKGIHSAVL